MSFTNFLALPAVAGLTGAETIALVQAGTDKKATLGQITGFSAGTTAVAANLAYVGPTTGAAAPPTFRALVSADIPAALQLGASGIAGSLTLGNATSGLLTVQPVTGALGGFTLSLPNATDQLIARATTDTLTNKTFDTGGAGNVLKINAVQVSAVTGTGSTAVLATSPALVTPNIGAAAGTSLSLTGAGTDFSATAIPAGGTAGTGHLFSSVANFGMFFGSGAPSLSAAQGSLYLRSDGAPWVNTSGSTTWFDYSGVAYVTYKVTGVNFNSANTDTSIAIVLPPGYTRYRLDDVQISHASATLTTATCGLFTASGGGGTALIPSGSAITVNTASENTNNNLQRISATNAVTMSLNLATLFFRVQTAQGSAATADISIQVIPQP